MSPHFLPSEKPTQPVFTFRTWHRKTEQICCIKNFCADIFYCSWHYCQLNYCDFVLKVNHYCRAFSLFWLHCLFFFSVRTIIAFLAAKNPPTLFELLLDLIKKWSAITLTVQLTENPMQDKMNSAFEPQCPLSYSSSSSSIICICCWGGWEWPPRPLEERPPPP